MTTSKRKGMQMRVNRKRMRPLFVAAAVMIAVSGCSGQGKETEDTSETATEKGTETQAVLEKVTYTSTDGSVSIILPDSGWVNTEDAGGKLSFSAEGKGEITIDYADSKKAVGTLAFGSTETKLKKRLEKLGVPVDAVEISDYTFDASTGIRKCSYTMKRTDAAAENVCTVTAVTAVSTRGYQVSGSIKTEDEALLAAVKESVNSFLVLQNPLTAEEQTETEAGQGEDASGSGSDEERYFFDEPGNTIYVKQNGDGVWVDKNGMPISSMRTAWKTAMERNITMIRPHTGRTAQEALLILEAQQSIMISMIRTEIISRLPRMKTETGWETTERRTSLEKRA